ncbi:MAG: cardiolipin synthase [Clostridia bacterium]|nr:cardiolipin synthase [Clostridia bacterium]
MAIRRSLIVLLGLTAQILLTFFVYIFFIEHIAIIHFLYAGLGVLLFLGLLKNSRSYSYILPWIVIILLFPLIGTLMYIVIGRNKNKSKVLKRIVEHEKEIKKYLVQDKDVRDEYKDNSSLRYISDYAGFPVTKNNKVDYYPLGEEAFPVILSELKKAEKFIFFEYFIVNHGKMWDSILEILEEKASNGVEVRVMYDDLGCLGTLKSSYPKFLEKKNIKCVAFNRLSPLSSIVINNRDHRKILVIDGKVAFSGGINIADEYINIGSKFGHWKDNAIKIEGEAVFNYTVMFLSMWNSFRDEDTDYNLFKHNFYEKIESTGFIAPYAETPFDDEKTGEDIYLNIINQANDYVYIFTPYLIIDTDMVNALNLAAKRGVDVRIVIPGIPDKRLVYTLSESYVEPLVKSGVKVYKYTPGFIHAKVFVADDHIATVGTINMDYRSLYLHFECGCYIENNEVVMDIKKDALDTIEKSYEITKKEVNPNAIKGFWQALLRLVAPLM